MAKSKRLEIIFHNGEVDGIRTYIQDETIFRNSDGKSILPKVTSFKPSSVASDFVFGGSTNSWVE